MNELLDELLENTKKFLSKNDENKKNISTQYDYNIFSVLNLAHREIYHSRFLADLLNPNGLHNQGNLFLEKFLDILPNKILNTCDLKNTVVITEEVTVNGNIDISIKNNDFYIIIENKVWAGDQDAQLYRYSKTIHNGKEPILIYLTPNGTKPTKNSLGNLKEENVIKISYKENITNWINICIENISNERNITNVLNQYIKIIEFKKEDIMDIEIQDDKIEEYLLLQKSLNQSILNKRDELINSFFDHLSDRLNEFIETNPKRIVTKSNGIYIYFYYHDNSYGLGLDASGLYIGYYREERDYNKEEYKILVESNKNFKQNRYIHLNYKITSTNEYYIKFIDSSKIKEDVNDIIEQIKKIIN